MLQKGTVSEKTFGLLRMLLSEPEFRNFFLVGGTSIALRLGHRKSIDLDLFTRDEIDVPEFCRYLQGRYGFKERFRAKNTLKGDIGDIFIDCIRYDYPLVRPLVEEEGVRLASLEDVCCMKLAAITDDGTRLKDFVDIAYLSARFSLGEMLGWYQEKYGDVSTMQPLKALLYYDDIDFDGEPVELINEDFSWEAVKGRLQLMTKNPGKVFASFPLPQPRRRERGGIER